MIAGICAGLLTPLQAQDGGPQPYCRPGLPCCASPIGSLTPLPDGASNKPCCYACERGQKTFGEINKDKEIVLAQPDGGSPLPKPKDMAFGGINDRTLKLQ